MADVSAWDRLRRGTGAALDRVGLKRPINHLRFSITRPSWWLDLQARRTFFRSFVPCRPLVFDIGANDGRTAEFWLDLGARVVAVEPQERCVRLLTRRLARRRRWTVVRTALGAEDGTAELAVVAEESQLASVVPAWIDVVSRERFADMAWTARETVPVTTLDGLIAEHGVPGFCKIDVEGAEPGVLAGLSTALPLLSFEYTPEFAGHLESCLERLSGLGDYRFNLALHGRWHWALPDSVDPDRLPSAIERIPDAAVGGDVYARRVANGD